MIKRIIESGLAGLMQQNARNAINSKSLDVDEVEKFAKLMHDIGKVKCLKLLECFTSFDS